MSIFNHPKFLRTVLLVDAATCIATGALMTVGAPLISDVTALPANLLFTAGVSLFPIAAFILAIATVTAPSVSGVWAVILGNVGWVIGSVLLLVSSSVTPNTLGVGFVLIQATAVAVLVEFEIIGVRRATAAR